MSKEFLGVIAAVIIIFIGIIAFGGNKDKTNGSSPAKNNSSTSQHITGKGSTGVTLVEYGDYQCPYCEQYYPTVKSAVQEFNDQIFFQFRHFPLTNLHQNAFAASRAAEAAGLQGKFWEMHDALYAPQNHQVWTTAANPNPSFEQYAAQLNLDTARFKKDFASSQVNDTINADMEAGNKLKITGTPSFFINGKKVEIANDLKSFQKVINEAIAQQTAGTNKSN